MSTLQRAVVLVLLAPALGADPANARQADTVAACDAARFAGVVEGVVVDDSTKAPIARRRVVVEPIGCTASTDAGGRFRIGGVPDGRWDVGLPGRHFGYLRFTPVPVTITAGATVTLELRHRPGDLIADCRETGGCGPLLEPPAESRRRLLSDTELLEEAALRTAVAILLRGRLDEWVQCATTSSAAVAAVLRDALPRLADAAECALPEVPPGRIPLGGMYHRPSGLPAATFRIDDVEREADRAIVRSAYDAGPWRSTGWICEFVFRDGAWRPLRCTVGWIS